MFKDLIKATGLSEDDITGQVKSKQNRGDQAMGQIRLDLDADYKLYRSTKRNAKKEKIGDWTVFSTHSALMALSYSNRPETEFDSDTASLIDQNKVRMLNAKYKTDFENDDIEILKYWEDFNMFMTGVSITGRTGWDGKNKRSTFECIDTRNWIPDPDGDYVTGNYSYCGFYKDMYKSELEEMDMWDNNINLHDNDSLIIDPRDRDNEGANVTSTTSTEEDTNPQYRIIYNVDTFVGKKGIQIAIIITANSGDLVLGVKVIESMPFSFKYWNPDGSITGMRVTKITGDTQRVKAEIANLRLDKSKAELYPMYLRNSRMIPNKSDLEFGLNKVIDTNPLAGENTSQALVPLQKDFRADNSFIIDQSLDRGVQEATAVNNVVKGSTPERREGVGVVDQMMESTDLIMAFRAKIESWGEKQRMRLYVNGLIEDLKKDDKMLIKINGAYGSVVQTITRKDIALDNIDVKVVTAVERSKTKQEMTVAYGQAIGMIQTLPMSESAKKYMYRDYFVLIGMSPEKAERIVDYTPDEITAIGMVGLLNEGIFLEVKPEYDAMTHLSMIKSARPGLNVDLYKRGLLGLYQIQGQQTNQTQGDQGMQNNLAAQAGAGIANSAMSLQSN